MVTRGLGWWRNISKVETRVIFLKEASRNRKQFCFTHSQPVPSQPHQLKHNVSNCDDKQIFSSSWWRCPNRERKKNWVGDVDVEWRKPQQIRLDQSTIPWYILFFNTHTTQNTELLQHTTYNSSDGSLLGKFWGQPLLFPRPSCDIPHLHKRRATLQQENRLTIMFGLDDKSFSRINHRWD